MENLNEESKEKLKEVIYQINKERTAIFLDYIDGQISILEQIKIRGKKMFMESQREILTAIKVILEGGEIPQPVDKRHVKNNGKSE